MHCAACVGGRRTAAAHSNAEARGVRLELALGHGVLQRVDLLADDVGAGREVCGDSRVDGLAEREPCLHPVVACAYFPVFGDLGEGGARVWDAGAAGASSDVVLNGTWKEKRRLRRQRKNGK